ncbi:MAG: phosphomethylpyrimidine synthase ThiC [Candidatus Omnitrophica bacterium]|nr:phosphomethylpyrimidine synthase ThiC [Candidatus Omnitrophota bacterium]
MIQLELAKQNKTTPQIAQVAKDESLAVELIRKNLIQGKIVIPNNKKRKFVRPCGIGHPLRTKVNANIGTSVGKASIKEELKKLEVAIRAGTDTVMDLSTGGDLKKIRKAMLKESCVAVGTVPLYEAAVDVTRRKKSIKDIREEDFFEVLEKQAEEGVDFFTIHSGVTLETISRLKNQGRILDIVSRGGAILVEWMLTNKRENPFYESFERVLKIAHKFDVTLSLGDGLRPGALADGTDRAQIQELIILGELAKKAREAGVQVMIEGPGHLPLDQIEMNVKLQKSLCDEAPFYVLGPLVTDIAPGYDHITSAIGGAIAASFGADFLCYVTPSEHLGLPSKEDVEIGVISSRIAAHAADIVKKIPHSLEWDANMSRARKQRDWKKQFGLAIEPNRPKKVRMNSNPDTEDVCTMCSKYCSIKIIEKYLK